MADTKHKMIYDGNRLHTWTETTPDSFDKFMSKAGAVADFANTGLSIYDTYQGIGQQKNLNQANIRRSNAEADLRKSQSKGLDAEQAFLDNTHQYGYNPRANPDSNETLTSREGISNRQYAWDIDHEQTQANLALTREKLKNKKTITEQVQKNAVMQVFYNTFPKISSAFNNDEGAPGIALTLNNAGIGGSKWVAGQDEQHGAFVMTNDLNGRKLIIPVNTEEQIKRGFMSGEAFSKMFQDAGTNVIKQLSPDKKIKITKERIENLRKRIDIEFPAGDLQKIINDSNADPKVREIAFAYEKELNDLYAINQHLFNTYVVGQQSNRAGINREDKKSKEEENFFGDQKDQKKKSGTNELNAIGKFVADKQSQKVKKQKSKQNSIKSGAENSMWGRSRSEYLPLPKTTIPQQQTTGGQQPIQAINNSPQGRRTTLEVIASETGGTITPSGTMSFDGVRPDVIRELFKKLKVQGVKFDVKNNELILN